MKTFLLALTVTISLLTTSCSEGESAIPVASRPVVTEPSPTPLPLIPPPPTAAARGYLLMDAANGQVLVAHNEHTSLEPASLTKIMTAYVVFDALRSGNLKLEDTVTISEHAWRVGGAVSEGSTSFLPVRAQVPVQALLQGIIVQSGNDASIALAEHLAGSEAAFAQLMNAHAKRLGLTGTHFDNSTGLPSPHHFTTAYDMALLARALIRDFPQYYPMFAQREYTFNGITQRNRNRLLDRDSSVDGLKTGHTSSAGYCLVSSAKRGDMRLISVVMGMSSERAREDASAALLNYGFSFFETQPLYAAGHALGSVRIWKGVRARLDVGLASPVVLTIPRGRANLIQTKLELPTAVTAPIAQATALGTVAFVLEGQELARQPLYPLSAVEAAGFFGRLYDSVLMTFQ